jgi:hypothetical protein
MVNPDMVDESFRNFWRHMVASVAEFDSIVLELKEILKKKDGDLTN